MQNCKSLLADVNELLKREAQWPYIYRIKLERTLLRLVSYSFTSLKIKNTSKSFRIKQINKIVTELENKNNGSNYVTILKFCRDIIETKDLISDRSHQSDDTISRIQFHVEPLLEEINAVLQNILQHDAHGDQIQV